MNKRETACASENALRSQVLDACAAGSALRIVGGRSKRALFPTAVQGRELSTAAHRGILRYAPEELVITARAGTPISEINAALAEHGQALSFEPPGDNGATLGGTVACNLVGPARPWRGGVRDAVLGLRLINGRGEVMSFGGEVMKNVAGYDVSRLQCGARGALGVITEVSLRVQPAAKSERSLCAPLAAGEALEYMRRLARRPLPLSGACWLQGRLYLRFAGEEAAVAAAVRAVADRAEDCDEEPWAALRELCGADLGRRPLYMMSLAPATPLDAHLPLCIDWAGGRRFFDGELVHTELQALARRGRGFLVRFGDDAPAANAADADSRGLDGLRARLKAAFDPQALFNRGQPPLAGVC